MTVREWMADNSIRVFAVTRGDIVPLWHYHAEHQDGRTRSYQVEPDARVNDEYILLELERLFSDDD